MPSFFEDVLTRLSAAKVEFVVVGGVSAVLQGAPLATFDLDICFRRTSENIARLLQALAPLKPRLRDFPPDLPFVLDERAILLGTNFTLTVQGGDLDLISEMSSIGGYDQVLGDADLMEIGTVAIRVLSLEKLIQSKRAGGRPKDLAALPLLEATLRQRNEGQ
jgi:hypothetical protein